MPVGVVNDVVEIGQVPALWRIPQDIHIPVREPVGGEYIVIRNDDYLRRVPDLGVLTKFPLENPDAAGTANIVVSKDICVYPNIISSLSLWLRPLALAKIFSVSVIRGTKSRAG